jgi:hypothetical protein
MLFIKRTAKNQKSIIEYKKEQKEQTILFFQYNKQQGFGNSAD